MNFLSCPKFAEQARVAARGNMPTRGERGAGPRRPEPDLRATKGTPRGGLGR